MGWWKKLKAWQKAGIVVGSIHLVIFMTLLYEAMQIHGESGVGYLLFFMEFPWIAILQVAKWNIGHVNLGTYTSMIIIGTIGTLIYALLAMALGLVLSIFIRKITYKK